MRAVLSVSAGLVACFSFACADSSPITPTRNGPVSGQPTAPVRIVITTPADMIQGGPAIQGTAYAEFANGTRVDLREASCEARWSSSTPEVVRVSATGLIEPIGFGTAVIAVDCEAVRGESTFSVRRGFRIAGLVHESAPTEDVLIADARVEIEGGELDGHVVTTTADGRFVLPVVTFPGFGIRVKRPGYEDARFDVLMLPRDEQADIGLRPAFGMVQEVWEVQWPLCWFLECPKFDRTFDVHHDGQLTFQDARIVLVYEWAIGIFEGERLIWGSNGVPLPSNPMPHYPLPALKAGFRYRLQVAVSRGYDGSSSRLVFSHPR